MNSKIEDTIAASSTGPGNGRHQILLTVDVEDWFHVENFRQIIHPSTWPSFESRVERNTYRLLELFSEIHAPSANTIADPQNNDFNRLTPKAISHKPGIHATFFILGWVAERMPHLVREIHSLGHEVASHGFNHELAGNCRHEDLQKDIVGSKKLLEDIIGGPVYGYRAPNFSINTDLLKLVEDSGYLYDSSYNSFSANSRYGRVDMTGNGNAGIAKRISEGFYELPISNIEWAGMVLPAGGGGYFRLYPLNLFCMGVKAMLRKQNAYMFYMHPWEIDPHQPRVKEASPLSRFRHYVNLDRTMGKLREFITGLDGCGFPTCRKYLCGC
jgi:polysaccharide deacetylase family protein (PEP-CTERM system associated)